MGFFVGEPMTPLAANEIRSMEKAGQLAARVLNHVGEYVKTGITTNELDQIANDFVLSNGAISAPLDYHGFPKAICTSINDCICHGVPDSTALIDGDIINIDITVIKDGFHGDTSRMFFIGSVLDEPKRLCDVAKKAMEKGIEAIAPFGTTGDIGFAINKWVTKKGYTTVKEIGGHGIGRTFHDDPFVPSHGKKGRGDRLKTWCCITVEPMVNETAAPIKEISIPNSTIKIYNTSDGTLSAQYEHTVLITDKRPQILTLDQ